MTQPDHAAFAIKRADSLVALPQDWELHKLGQGILAIHARIAELEASQRTPDEMQKLLDSRDEFIVSKGLFEEYVATLKTKERT